VAPVLCMVTSLRSAGSQERLVACVAAAARAGVDLVQLRERQLAARALTELVERAVAAVRGSRTRVLVNDRLDIALAAGAQGVHLPASGIAAARARAIAPSGFLIGRSVHDASEAARVAGDGGLDYLLFGTVFPSASKPDTPPAGVDALAATVAAVPLPVLAIGGVTLERAGDLARSGAAGAAAIGMFAEACARDPSRLPALVAEWARQWR
jgi:thiamine-phosphate diphosphorylase